MVRHPRLIELGRQTEAPRDVKKNLCTSRVGDIAAGVVVWPCFQKIPRLGAPTKFSLKNCELLNTVSPNFPKSVVSALEHVNMENTLYELIIFIIII